MSRLKNKFLSVLLSATMVAGMLSPMGVQAGVISGDDYVNMDGMEVKISASYGGDLEDRGVMTAIGGDTATFASLVDNNTNTGITLRGAYDNFDVDGIAAGDFFKVEFKEAITFENAMFTFQSGTSDIFQESTFSYTTNGTEWVNLDTVESGTIMACKATEPIEGVTAIKLTNNVEIRKWVNIVEIDVNTEIPEGVWLKNITASGYVKVSGTAAAPSAATEGQEGAGNGIVSAATDSKKNSFWHSSYTSSEVTDLRNGGGTATSEYSYIEVALAEATDLAGVTYLPRQLTGYDYSNGAFKTFKVQVKTADGNWTDADIATLNGAAVTTANFAGTDLDGNEATAEGPYVTVDYSKKRPNEEKELIFTEIQEDITAIKFVVKESYGSSDSQKNMFLNAAEIAALKANVVETPTEEPTTEPTEEPTTEPTTEPTVEPENAALNKSAKVGFAAAVDGMNPANDGSPASKAVDGQKNSNSHFAGWNDAYENIAEESRPSVYFEVNLGKVYDISEVKMWRYWDNRAYQNTMIIASVDENFDAGEDDTVIFNAASEAYSYGYGAGTGETYPETTEGHTFPAEGGTQAQYVRVYMRGSIKADGTAHNGNHLVELEVWGTEAQEVTPTETPVPPVTEEPTEDGLVSYYTFDVEDDTTVLVDEMDVANGNIAESATFVDGKFGKAMSVNVAAEGGVVTNDITTYDAADWSVSYWVKTTAELNQEVSVLEDSTQNFSLSLMMGSAASRQVPGFRVGNNDGDVLSFKNITFEKDVWYHIAWVQNKTTGGLTLYVNGVRKDANSWTTNHDLKAPIEVIGGTGFTGLIDEVKVYSKVLTAEEIAALAVDPSPEANYAAVRTALAKVPADLSVYTETTANAVTEAVNAVVYGKPATEQAAVDAMAEAIEEAVAALAFKDADYTAVEEAKAKVPADLSVYTDETAKAVTDALAAVVYGKNITEQSAVNAMAAAIADAVAALAYKPADYSAVEAAIEKVPSSLDVYTEETAKAVNDAIAAVVYDKNITEQAEVDAMAEAIEEAVEALAYKPADYTAVEEAKASVPADLSVYTDETAKAVTDALAAVVYGKNITEQTAVNAMAAAIADAVTALEYKPADYSAVEAALEKVPSNLSVYTDETAKAVTDAVNAVVRDKNITEQAEVDAMAEAIEDAVAALEFKGADYSAVEAALAKVPDDLTIYTEATAKAVNDAVAAVDYNKNSSEQAEVDAMAEAIEDAVAALEYKPADYSVVEAAIEKVPSSLDVYTDETAKAVNDAIAAVVYDKNITEQAEVDAMAEAIEEAVEALAYKPADYTAVEEAKASVPADLSVYTDETVKAVNDAVAAVVYGKNITEQSAVNAMAEAIEDAVTALEYKPADYSAVEAAIEKVPSSLDVYTDETVKAVNDAIAAVVYDKNITEQSEVDAMAQAIEEAVEALAYKPADYTAVEEAKASVPADLSVYTDETAKAVTDALAAVVYGKNITEQTAVNAMAAAIADAVAALEYKPADYSAVEAALEKVPSNLSVYTDETAKAVTDAVNAVVRDKNITEQTEVDAMAEAIEDAVAALEFKGADYSAVEAALAKVPDDLTIYTDETANAVKDAVAAVDYNKNGSEQAEVDAMAEAIEDAVAALEYKPADYSVVEAAIEKVPSSLDVYTDETAKAVNDAIAAVDYNKNITEQSEVDAMAEAIEEAVEALAYKPADYTAVEEAKASVPADLSVYTDETVKAVNDALAAVVYGKNITEQTAVNAMAAAIADAVAALEYKPADYSVVEAAIEKVPSSLDVYTEETAKAVNDAIAAVVYDKNITEQAEVDAMAEAIEEAVEALAYKPADYTAVEEAKASVPADLSVYTDETAKAVTDAVAAVVYGKNITEQTTVNAMAASIADAVAALAYKPADYSAVEAAIEKVPSSLDVYTEETVKAVNDAISAVVYDKNITEQAEVDAMAEAIEDAVAALEFKGADYSAVEAALAKVPDDLTIYTDETANAVKDAVAAVDYNKNGSEQAEVDAMAEAIEDAVAALEYKPADYTAVEEAKASVPADLSVYTEETVKAVNDAIAAVVYDKNITEQSEVDAMAEAVEEAVGNLAYKPADYTAVDEALAKVPADLTVYTEETAKAVTDAVNAVVRDKDITEQSAVDAMAKAIADAVAALQLLPTPTPTTTPEPTPDASDASKDIDVELLTATTGNAQALGGNNTTEGPAELVLDGNTGTLWHTNWNGSDRSEHWIAFEISDEYDAKVDGLRYLPRANAGGTDAFGVITSYKVEVSKDGETWETAAEGTWANDPTWKAVYFDAQDAKYVRLVSVDSVSDHRTFTSAAEIRLTGTVTPAEPLPTPTEEPTPTPTVEPTATPTPTETEAPVVEAKEYGLNDVTITMTNDVATTDNGSNVTTLTQQGSYNGLFDGLYTRDFEFKWDIEANYVNGALPAEVTLPLTLHVTLNEAGPLNEVVVYNANKANGYAIRAKAVLNYADGTTSEKLLFALAEEERVDNATYNFVWDNDGKAVESVDITILRAIKKSDETVKNMLTLAELELAYNPDATAPELPAAVDKDALEQMVKEAKEKDLTAYTEASAQLFKDMITSAEAVLADEDAMEEDVVNAKAGLENATAGLVEKPTETETPVPTETEAPVPTETEAPQPTETEAPQPTETPGVTEDVTTVFDDVYEDWYTDYVQYVYDNGLMTGIKGTKHFAPNANITKAQVAQVLYNMEDQPEVTDQKVFTELNDVYTAEWYADAVAWAYNTGVVTGDLNTKKFNPNADVTREQLALMMFRYAGYKGYDVTATSDYEGLVNADKVNNWAAEGMSWAVGAGLISGIEKNGVKDLAPQGNASRAQVAAILQRFCENVK